VRSERLDQIYTPPDLAELMVKTIIERPPGVIADFSVGGGELLRAASARWPKASLLGIDLDGGTISRLKKANEHWKLETCDFLNDLSVSSSELLNRYKGRVGLVLLNPPFSCKGGTRLQMEFGGERISVSPALAFLLRALAFLKITGVALALMPAGSLISEKDATAWRLVSRRYKVRVVSRNARDVFHPYIAKTVVVRLEYRKAVRSRESRAQLSTSADLIGISIKIKRGSNQLHSLQDENAGRYYRLIHTTSMKCGTTAGEVARVRRASADVRAAAVLIPRVGLPALSKVALHRGPAVCLSDCVIALTVVSDGDLERVWSFFKDRWQDISILYGGTGAPYLTVKKLQSFLAAHGAQVSLGSM
jgi:predicted RNA methylase